jgi:hypothetical protein
MQMTLEVFQIFLLDCRSGIFMKGGELSLNISIQYYLIRNIFEIYF